MQLSPIPKQFLDSSGLPYKGGTLEVYLAGELRPTLKRKSISNSNGGTNGTDNLQVKYLQKRSIRWQR